MRRGREKGTKGNRYRPRTGMNSDGKTTGKKVLSDGACHRFGNTDDVESETDPVHRPCGLHMSRDRKPNRDLIDGTPFAHRVCYDIGKTDDGETRPVRYIIGAEYRLSSRRIRFEFPLSSGTPMTEKWKQSGTSLRRFSERDGFGCTTSRNAPRYADRRSWERGLVCRRCCVQGEEVGTQVEIFWKKVAAPNAIPARKVAHEVGLVEMVRPAHKTAHATPYGSYQMACKWLEIGMFTDFGACFHPVNML
jgi:hypothetical protein